MPNDKDTEIKSRYEDYSVEELRAALDAIFDSTDEFSDSDVEKMDEIMAVLDKKNPLPQKYTAEESLKHFFEDHREELSRLGIRSTEEVMEKESEEIEAPINNPVVMLSACCSDKASTGSANEEKKPCNCCRNLFRIAMIAAAVVAVMVIVTVSAAAAGINIWGWVQVRSEGTVRFVSEDALSKDIPAALKQAGIEEPLFPTWIPEGFLLQEQQIRLDEPIRINSTYVYKDRVISIIARSLNDDYPNIIEIEDANPQEYLSSGIVHYIISNCDQLVAYWINGGILVTISGDLSAEEIEHIIDSIYNEV